MQLTSVKAPGFKQVTGMVLIWAGLSLLLGSRAHRILDSFDMFLMSMR